MRLFRLFAAIALLGTFAMPAVAGSGPVTVFAAASLTDVLSNIGKAYEAKTGAKLAFSFAGSSVLAKQIDASGGADVYLSADEAWMDYLEKRGRIVPASREDLLGNSLVLIAPKAQPVTITVKPGFALVKALHGGRLAVADTDTVPAGRYAREALTALGVWKAASAHLASAENVRVALAYVARGEAPLGIVYRTDALIEPAVTIAATFPASSHKRIVYPAALLKGARPGARRFLEFLHSAAARALFEKAGFTPLAPSPGR